MASSVNTYVLEFLLSPTIEQQCINAARLQPVPSKQAGAWMFYQLLQSNVTSLPLYIACECPGDVFGGLGAVSIGDPWKHPIVVRASDTPLAHDTPLPAKLVPTQSSRLDQLWPLMQFLQYKLLPFLRQQAEVHVFEQADGAMGIATRWFYTGRADLLNLLF